MPRSVWTHAAVTTDGSRDPLCERRGGRDNHIITPAIFTGLSVHADLLIWPQPIPGCPVPRGSVPSAFCALRAAARSHRP